MAEQALWHVSKEKTEWRPVEQRDTPAGYVWIEALYSLISTGTERLVARGDVPVSAQEVMRVPYQEGSLALPVKYGYSLVGSVRAAGHALDGRVVQLLHPHQSGMWADPQHCYPVPAGIPARRAILAGNMETALTAVWDSGVSAGDRVGVVGFGMIGGLLARLLSGFPALELFVIEKDPHRRTLAAGMGFRAIAPGGNPQDLDLAFHTTATGPGLQLALDAVAREGKVVELSWYGSRETSLQLGGSFHYDRKQLISSQVSHLPSDRLPRWDTARRKAAVFRLLREDGYDRHLTNELTMKNTPAFFEQLRQGETVGLGSYIKYEI